MEEKINQLEERIAQLEKQAVKPNLTINLESLVKGGIQCTHKKNMDEKEIEELMNNLFMRVVKNVEVSY